MGVGSNEMVDLDFLEDRADERPTPRAGGTDFFDRGERAKDSAEQGQKNA